MKRHLFYQTRCVVRPSRFLRILQKGKDVTPVARGSLRELSTQLEICERVNYLEQSRTVKAKYLIGEIDKMLNALSNSLIPF